MTALLVPAVLAVALLTTAVAGPVVIRAAAPALMRAPRAAVTLLLAVGALWLVAAAALSLLLAWVLSGPTMLPSGLAGVCQRCLDASSPFPAVDLVDTVVPVALLIALPVAGALVLVATAIFRGVRRLRATRATARDIAARADSRIVGGHRVMLTRDLRPTAFSLPHRHGGIVLSRGLVEVLHPDELAAVIAHEREHVHGRHHLALGVLEALIAPLHRLPLMSAIRNAVPLYLEIAADRAASRQAGTPALASALLKLGGTVDAHAPTPHRVVLHAAGPDRIGHLVSPARIGASMLPAVALGAVTAAFALMAVVVHGPYLSVIVTGCHLAT